MTNRKDIFKKIVPTPGSRGDGRLLTIKGKGVVLLETTNRVKVLPNVLYVPQLS
jgi:hypothetical protein